MLPTIKSDSIYPLPNDVAIFNINIVDIIFLIQTMMYWINTIVIK